MMHSTRSPSTIFLRMSPSPDCCEESDPFASTTPATTPCGPSFEAMCCNEAKLAALLGGGVPYFQRGSPQSRFPAPVGNVLGQGRTRKDEVRLEVGVECMEERVAPPRAGGENEPRFPESQGSSSESPGRVIQFLAVHGDVVTLATVELPQSSQIGRTCLQTQSTGHRPCPCTAQSSLRGA